MAAGEEVGAGKGVRALRIVDWIDGDGMRQRSLLPDGVGDEDAALGVPVGLDLIEGLERQGMPYATAVKLQSELRQRGFFTYGNLNKRRATEEIFAALQSAYRTDTAAVINLYKEAQDNG